VFNFALARVPHSIDAALNLANKEKEDIDFFVLHQANGLITKTIARKLALPMDRFLSSIDHFGNTSSGSIPLTLVVNSAIFKENKAYSMILSGFGVGFSWASVYMELAFPSTKLITYGEV
jgi:3-oxoacyl-[acyl-carrier-protein] synthase-3